VGEQGAEPGWLRFAHEPGRKQVACGVVIDGGGLQGCPDRLAAKANQFLERIPLGAGGRSDVPFAGELRVAQAGRSCKKRVDLGTVFPDESVRRAGGSSRLAQRSHFVCLVLLAGLSQLTLGLVACLRELVRGERIQLISDLFQAHVLILAQVVRSRGEVKGLDLPMVEAGYERSRPFHDQRGMPKPCGTSSAE
jgi:hypothetical protein